VSPFSKPQATQTAVVKIAARKYQSTEVTAVVSAEEPEDNPEDKGGVQDVQGVCDPQDETPDDRDGVTVPTQCDENATEPVMEKAETKSTEVEAHDDTPDDGCHVQEHPPDEGGDDEDYFSDAEEGCSVADEDRAETPITVQTEHVHKAVTGQEDADQDGRDDHNAAASRERGDGGANIPD
jgi:hypothetical protein